MSIKNGVFLWKTKKKIIETIRKKNNLLYIKDSDAKTCSIIIQRTIRNCIQSNKKVIDRGVEPSPKYEFSNKVWVCRFQGYESAPPLVKACINSMHRVMPEKEIIVNKD